MHWIGIDVSKSKLDMALTNQHGIVLENKEVKNTSTGITKQLERWRKKHGLVHDQCLVCLEPTGHYSDLAVTTLVDLKVPTWLAMPLDIKRSMGLARGKNDRIDAERIAHYARRHHERSRLATTATVDALELKQLLAFRDRLAEDQRRQGVYISEVHKYAPATSGKLFDDYSKQRIEEIKLAKKQVDRSIQEFINNRPALRKLNILLRSVIGIGPVVAAHLLATTEGFTKFITPRQLACHCGVAPHSYTSGTSINGRSRVSPFANKKLKSLLHLAVLGMLNYPNELHDYYDRKKEDGKHALLVLNNMKRKLIDRICAVIDRGTPFVAVPSPR